MSKIAFLGLGVMGYPMAGHIAAAGHEVTVYNRTTARAEAWVAKHGGSHAPTPAAAAARADIVLSCVGDDPDVLQVALGPDGAILAMRQGAIYIDNSTVSADVARKLAAAGSDFFHGVQLTRSEALRAGRRAEMRPRDGRDWQSGWEIRVGQQVVAHHRALEVGIAVAYTTGGELVAYQPDGQPVTRGSWYFSSGMNSRAVVINFLGRVRICNPVLDNQCSLAAPE